MYPKVQRGNESRRGGVSECDSESSGLGLNRAHDTWRCLKKILWSWPKL